MPRFTHASHRLPTRATRLGSTFLPLLFACVAFCALACACATARAASFDPNQAGLSGSWANAATDGQGFVFDVVEDFHGEGRALIFGGWFTYDTDAAGGVRWYTVQGELARQGASTMAIYQTLGGSFDSPQPATTQAIGEFSIEFTDCTHASANYRFDDGRTGDLPLARLLGNATCRPGASSPAAPGSAAWSGAWADPSNGGQGLVLEFNPDQQLMFGAWYAFARGAAANAGAAGQDWYTLQTAVPAGATSIADIGIYATRDGRFDAHAATTTTRVGTVKLDMQDCVHATLAYEFTAGALAGSQGTLALLRLTPPQEGCAVPAPAAGNAEGYWKGTSKGQDFRIIVPGDGTYAIVFQHEGVDQRFVYGTLVEDNGQFVSNDGAEFAIHIGALADARATDVGVAGSFVARQSMQLRLTRRADSELLSATWDPTYETPARVADAAGGYQGYAAVTVNGLAVDFSIDATGQFSGSIGGGACSVSARLQARGATNLFDFILRGLTPSCLFGAGPLTGLAWYDTATRSFHSYTPFAGRSRMQYMLGSRVGARQTE
ncbi:hypothetical protein [Dokdonella sp.]|uniref:hypothetical protein n=1 Tax=Dokdonella sp. TaxID=2291710 RepID=UPI0025C111A4|nr:hypothetical protein [Dokdonella sp.]MBX3688561.1 hypothetical protein [Dokdonella sp.]